MAGTIQFAAGTIQFPDFEKQENCNFVKSSTTKLKVSETVRQQIVDDLVYKYIRYDCKMSGEPRATIAATHRKRKTKSYRQSCPVFFTLSYKMKNGIPILQILKMNNDHGHV